MPLGGDTRVSTQWDESACQPLKNRGTGSVGPGSLTRSPWASEMKFDGDTGRGWVSGTGPGSVERHVKQLHVMDNGEYYVYLPFHV